MKLTKLHIHNFKGFENLDVEFHPNFNIVVGINGTGKSTLLEASKIAIGSLFLELDKYKDKISSPGITTDNVRLHNLELQYPTIIQAFADIDGGLCFNKDNCSIEWKRVLEKHGGRTTKIQAKEISKISSNLQKIIRKTATETTVNIPLIAYYSTDRFKKEKKDVGVTARGSRLRGYYNAMDQLTNIKFFLELFKTETLYELQHQEKSIQLAVVKKAVEECIEDCEKIYYDVSYDKLLIDVKSANELIPFFSLSDGVRTTLSLVMEIAFRCYLLNPHLEFEAAKLTEGVVLIDEIDLHLHPTWQKKIVSDLRKAFPNIQFIVTTHAPLVIGSLKEGALFNISENKLYQFQNQFGRDANAILKEMNTEPMDDELQNDIDNYFILIENEKGKSQEAISLRKKLEQKLGEDHAELLRADIMLNFFE